MNKPITIRIDETSLDKFKKLYPKLLARYINNSIKIALKNKDFLMDVLLREV